jgi:hypothetical protein
MFSAVQGVIIAPLSFTQANRLVVLWERKGGLINNCIFAPNFEDSGRTWWLIDARSALAFHNFDIADSGRGEHIAAIRVSSRFLAALGVEPEV